MSSRLQQSVLSSVLPPSSIYASLDQHTLSAPSARHVLNESRGPFVDPEQQDHEQSDEEQQRGRTPTRDIPVTQEQEDDDAPPASIMYDRPAESHSPSRTRVSQYRARFAPDLPMHSEPSTSAMQDSQGVPSVSVSRSRSPSTSPPPDYIRSSPLSPQNTGRDFASSRISVASRISKGKARAFDSPTSIHRDLPQVRQPLLRSPLPPRPSSIPAPVSPYTGSRHGLRLGGARAWSETPLQQVPGSRSASDAPDLSRRERALWRWINVIDLDSFLTEVYVYYTGKGIWCIALERLLNLLTIAFVIIFSVFLVGCIDYSTIRQKHTLADAIVDRCISRFHPTTLLFVLIFGAAYTWRVIQFGKLIGRLWGMHEFFEELLNVPEADVQTIPWHEIVNRISALREEHPSALALQQNQQAKASNKLDAHDVANRVMRETNYMIALFNRDVLNLEVPLPTALQTLSPLLKGGQLTKSLEWNLRFCLMKFLFGPDGRVRSAFVSSLKRRELIEGLRRRFVLMGFLNAALAPFIVVYVLMYSFFRYFQEYHKNPSSIGSRAFTELALWKFREYNELPHVFKERIDLAHSLSQTYLDQFPKAKTALIARFIAFVAGSFASILILFSILDPDAFLHFEVTPERSVLFYIGIFGTILAVARGMVPEEHRVMDPTGLMQTIVEHTHYMPAEWKGRLHSTEVHAAFSQLFQMKISTFAVELFSVITTPFVLWYTLPECAPAIIDFFRESTLHVDGLGHVCSFGVFDFKRPGGVKPQPSSSSRAEVHLDGKMEKSLLNFKSHHPDWQPREETTSLYLSNLQSQYPSGRRSTRFPITAMASTTLIAEETEAALQEQERRAEQYERAFRKASAPATRYTESEKGNNIIEEDALGEVYGDERFGEDEAIARQHDTDHATLTGLVQEVYRGGNKGW